MAVLILFCLLLVSNCFPAASSPTPESLLVLIRLLFEIFLTKSRQKIHKRTRHVNVI